jgi:pimeloyl-ACP methyl ester carboxylesterase
MDRDMQAALEQMTVRYEMMGEGRPIIMLHAWPCDHRYIASAMEPIFAQRQGWKRIYPDLPGMGKTSGPAWMASQDQVLDILLEFIDAVIPGQRFVLAGASYGAYLARGIIHHRPDLVDGLLLVSPMIEPDESRRILPQPTTLVEEGELLSEIEPDLAEALRGFAVVQSKQLLEHIQENIFPALEIADHKFLAKVKKQYAFSFDVDDLPEPFTAPTLILAGRQDSISGYQDAWGILENYPRATFVVLDRAGHALEVEQARLFRTLVAEWLDRVEEKRGAQS